MSSFRCPYYVYDSGKYICLKLDNSRWNYLSASEVECYCWNEDDYMNCPYYNR